VTASSAAIAINGVASPSVINASAGTEAAVALTGGPGNATDWVALYAVGAGNGQYLAWNYEFRLFANNSYQFVATSPTVARKTARGTMAVRGRMCRLPTAVPKGDISALKDGVVTRAILFDATLLPGKAPPAWLESGTAVHREDLEALEKIEHVKVSDGDVILLYTGRWKRRAAVGPWKTSEGVAGWHADVAFFLKERSVSFIGSDEWNDVSPTTFPQAVGLPVHKLALVALGVDIFDNLDFERVVETARRLNRYEFMFSAAPLLIEKGTGSPLNPIAIF